MARFLLRAFLVTTRLPIAMRHQVQFGRLRDRSGERQCRKRSQYTGYNRRDFTEYMKAVTLTLAWDTLVFHLANMLRRTRWERGARARSRMPDLRLHDTIDNFLGGSLFCKSSYLRGLTVLFFVGTGSIARRSRRSKIAHKYHEMTQADHVAQRNIGVKM